VGLSAVTTFAQTPRPTITHQRPQSSWRERERLSHQRRSSGQPVSISETWVQIQTVQRPCTHQRIYTFELGHTDKFKQPAPPERRPQKAAHPRFKSGRLISAASYKTLRTPFLSAMRLVPSPGCSASTRQGPRFSAASQELRAFDVSAISAAIPMSPQAFNRTRRTTVPVPFTAMTSTH